MKSTRLTALLTTLLSATAPGCVELDVTATEPDLAETEQAATISNRPVSNLTGGQLDAVATTAKADGFRPISVSVYGDAGSALYAAVFVQRAGVDWKVMRGTGAGTFQTTFSAMAQSGYKPTRLSFEGPADNPVWAAVFEKTSSGIPYVRHTLVSGSALSSSTIQYWLKKAVDEKLIPTALASYGSAASPRFALVLEPNPAKTAWAVGRMSWNGEGEWNGTGLYDSLASFSTLFNVRTAAGLSRPAIMSNTLDNFYTVLFREDSVGGYFTRVDQTKAQLDAEITTQAAAGRIPIQIEGRGTSSRRFAVTFAATDVPYAREFSSVGTGLQRDTAVPAIDDMFKTFMTNAGVRNAGLAVLYKNKLVYARGYNLTEPGTRTVTPTSYFRIASLSKTVTAFEIMKLVEEGLLDVDDTAQEHLNLTRLDGNPVSGDFAGITIRELLTHNYPSLTAANGTQNCLKRDMDLHNASAMGTTLPISTDIAVRYALQDPGLIVPRTAGCYSNLAFSILGMIVEAKRGTSFETAIRTDLFAPSGIKRFRVASNDPTRSDEALYRSPMLSTWSSAVTPGSPLANTYGGTNLAAMLSTGGMSMAPAELARLYAVAATPGSTLLYDDQNPLSPADPVKAMLDENFGYDGRYDDNQTLTSHWYKTGALDGLNSTAAFNPYRYSYVITFARNGVTSSEASGMNWYPYWDALHTEFDTANLDARNDLFPTLGMPSL